jgi:hypothetical protein
MSGGNYESRWISRVKARRDQCGSGAGDAKEGKGAVVDYHNGGRRSCKQDDLPKAKL